MRVVSHYCYIVMVASALIVRPAPAAPAEDDKVVKVLNGDTLKELIEQEGYRGVTVDKISPKFHAVVVKMDGKRVVFYCDLENGTLQGRFVITGTNANARKINAWNESKKFFKAHLDKDGDPVCTYDLVIRHGVTRKSVVEFVGLMETGVKAFVKEVCE